MKRLTPRIRTAAAFTLIELLVVVAIIALLIAILLPSLGRARENAKIVVCGTHMRGIAQAHLMYIDDNRGRVIIGAVSTGNTFYPNGWFWATQLVAQGYIAASNNIAPGGGLGSAIPRGIFFCPDGALTPFPDPAPNETYPRCADNLDYSFAGPTTANQIGIYSWYQTNMSNISGGNDMLNQGGKGAATPFINFNAKDTAQAGDGLTLATTASFRRTKQFIINDGKMVMLMESPNMNVYIGASVDSMAPRLSGRHGDALSNKISPTVSKTDGYTNFAFFDGHVSKYSTVPYSNGGYNITTLAHPMPVVPDTIFSIQAQQ